MTPKTDTLILIKAMRRLAEEIQSEDGVANAAIAEAADRLEELRSKVLDDGLTIVTIEDIVTNDKRSNKAKVLAIQYVLRYTTKKEAQP
jgi:hypothetical protein